MDKIYRNKIDKEKRKINMNMNKRKETYNSIFMKLTRHTQKKYEINCHDPTYLKRE